MDNETLQQYSIGLNRLSKNEQSFLDDLVHETLIDAGFNPDSFTYELKVSFVETESE